MAGYNTIRGLKVKYLSADPANPEDGQVWYNAGTGNLRLEGIALAGSWASGDNLNTARSSASGTKASTANAALIFGGHKGSGTPANMNENESYDGTSWTEVADLATARRHATTGNGSAVNAIQAGGETNAVVANTEEWTQPHVIKTIDLS